MTLESNIAKAKAYMARFASEGVMNHIDGENVPAKSGKTFETVSPVDLARLANVAKGAEPDIDAAVAAAKAAFPAWSKMPGAERRKILIKVAEAIEARARRDRLYRNAWIQARPCASCPRLPFAARPTSASSPIKRRGPKTERSPALRPR